VHVVVIRDDASRHDYGNQQRAINNRSARKRTGFAWRAAIQFDRYRRDEPGTRYGQAEFPGPKHQFEMILASHLAPEGQPHLNRNKKFENEQRADEALSHGG